MVAATEGSEGRSAKKRRQLPPHASPLNASAVAVDGADQAAAEPRDDRVHDDGDSDDGHQAWRGNRTRAVPREKLAEEAALAAHVHWWRDERLRAEPIMRAKLTRSREHYDMVAGHIGPPLVFASDSPIFCGCAAAATIT